MNTKEKIEIYNSDYLLRNKNYIPSRDLAEIMFNFSIDDDYDVVESFIKDNLDKKSVFSSGNIFDMSCLMATNLKSILKFTSEEELDKYAKSIRFCSFFENSILELNDYIPYDYLNYNKKYIKYNFEDKNYNKHNNQDQYHEIHYDNLNP